MGLDFDRDLALDLIWPWMSGGRYGPADSCDAATAYWPTGICLAALTRMERKVDDDGSKANRFLLSRNAIILPCRAREMGRNHLNVLL